MKKDKVRSKKREYDTCSITMELEKPLLYEEEQAEIEKKRKKLKKQSINRTIIKTILILLICSVLGFFIWLTSYYAPTSEAESYLKTDDSVEVSIDNNFICFTPKNITPTKGFILYPAAKVDAKSYAKLCKMISEQGYQVVAVDMPLNFSAFGKNKANEVIQKYSNIEHWAIGGDSLGGLVATRYVNSNPEKIDGVVLISSYPSDSYLKEVNMNVLSIWGSKDGVIDFQALIDAKEKLPQKTTYVEIEGANHSQFGDYGKYKDDESALISEEKQQQKTVDSIVQFLENIN
ncbi:MAG: alpha/beta hydrolase [Intestinibacter bartlettii]|uniref:alpha/beta hydrolase n=1 Tax=Intestinibacter bartlettii TaxID=261299 RepID=UPI0026EBCC1E|nr:alpha/beta hydrolase [Intestinibacter bartlettii]MDO5010944.1 alpha/beta hydrolase [Intestinibacter bartlettii]